ncbi:protein PALS1-like [Babylonia areolata]|uniref:protein PALS1-like n=1 Tax=Babylonia areolata TaxID=304850 RepID=UPI003FD5CF7C
MPVSEKKRKSNSSKTGGVNGSIDLEAFDMSEVLERERESPRKGKGGKGKKGGGRGKATSNPDTLLIEDMMNRGGELASNGNSSDHKPLSHSFHDLHTPDQEWQELDLGYQHSAENSFMDTGPHREMAIDCPESFLATVKSPPRYPPPPNSKAESNVSSATPPRMPLTALNRSAEKVNDRTDAMAEDIDRTVGSGMDRLTVGAAQPKPTAEQLERLRMHQEELRKRREEENRYLLEQDFLRHSLRSSQKLQALESRQVVAPPPSGVVNQAFDTAGDMEGEVGEEVDTTRQASAQVVPTERYLKKNTGVEDMLSTLHHIRSRLNSADNTSSIKGSQEIFFLKTLFHNTLFQQAVGLHQKIVDITSRGPQPKPMGNDSQRLAADVGSSSPGRESKPVLRELVALLHKPVLKNLLEAHDGVASRQTVPVLHLAESKLVDFPLMQFGKDSVKIVHLEKTNEHLGATVKNEGDSVIIARIVNGGAAQKSGLLHEGDEILDVNGIDMRGKSIDEVSEILANMTGRVTFMIIPAHTCMETSLPKPGEMMHLRALFNYDPEDDPYLPCRELGISFMKGDILHAMQLTDPNWWQAHREGEEEHSLLAGLIPSRAFQEQRESVLQQLNTEGKENKKRNRICACGRKERKKRKKKILYDGGMEEEPEEILTYEEVMQYYPQPNRKRPIVLIGPADVGRQELRERIMESDFERFAAAVPHTSRAQQPEEQNGRDYHFTSRSMFEADMLSGKFLEYGEFQNNLYGTSIEAVRQVILQGRVCVLNLEPESLKILRDTDLKPYTIFVSPPNMEKLRQLQITLGKLRPTDEQLKGVMDKGREMEEAYGHFFDYVLVNMDLDRSYHELLQEINRIETEPQWVPVAWMNSYT